MSTIVDLPIFNLLFLKIWKRKSAGESSFVQSVVCGLLADVLGHCIQVMVCRWQACGGDCEDTVLVWMEIIFSLFSIYCRMDLQQSTCAQKEKMEVESDHDLGPDDVQAEPQFQEELVGGDADQADEEEFCAEETCQFVARFPFSHGAEVADIALQRRFLIEGQDEPRPTRKLQLLREFAAAYGEAYLQKRPLPHVPCTSSVP